MGDTTGSRPERDLHRPDPPLPDESSLTLAEYLEMQKAIANPTRYRILRTLTLNGELSPSEIRGVVDVASDTLSYHLGELVDVGLVQKRKRRTPDSRGLYTYYKPTSMGTDILEYGVHELMRQEHEFNDTYSTEH